MKRLPHVDALAGLAILLIVFGHAIQPNVPDRDALLVFRVIYSFSMPLLVFLAGYVAQGRISLINKAIGLLVPFVAWYWISYLLSGTYQVLSPQAFLWRVMMRQDWGLWLFWVLFVSFCLLRLALSLPRHKDLALAALVLVLQMVVARWRLVGEFAAFPLIQWYFLFFVGGYLAAKHRTRLSRYSLPIQIVSLLSFPFLVSFWYKDLDPSFVSVLNLPGLVFVYRYVVPLVGIGGAFLVARLVMRTPIGALLGALGANAMPIFVIHQLLIYLLLGTLGAAEDRVVPYFGIALVLSIAGALILGRSWMFSLVLFGRLRGNVEPLDLAPEVN